MDEGVEGVVIALFLDLFGVDDLLPAALEAADHGVAGDDLAATLP